MRVILQEKVEHLGEPFDVVNVKEGYARNYLIPKKIAVVATAGNVNRIALMKKQRESLVKKTIEQAAALAKKIGECSLTIAMKTGENDKLFGSVTSQHIIDELKKNVGMEAITKKMIHLEEPIRALGIYNISIKLHPDVTATVKTWVVKE